VFADIGPVFQVHAASDPLRWLGFLNSDTVKAILRVFQVGDRGRFMWIANIIEQIPCPSSLPDEVEGIAAHLLNLFLECCGDSPAGHDVG
jgi:hypothetical protein